MAKTVASGNQTGSVEVTDLRQQMWTVLFAGLIIGIGAMHLMVQRPMQFRLTAMEKDLNTVQRRMISLTGTNSTVTQVNDLLTALTAQRAQIADAREALAEIRRLNRDVQAEAGQTTVAFEALDRIAMLQETLMCQDGSTDLANDAVDRMVCLNHKLIDESRTAEEARISLDRLAALKETLIVQGEMTPPAAQALSNMIALEYVLIDEQASAAAAALALNRIRSVNRDVRAAANDVALTQFELRQLADLKLQVLSQSDGIDEAISVVNRLAALKAHVIDETDDLESAETAVEELLVLKDDLVIRGGNTFTAHGNVNRLMSLRDALSVKSESISTAEKNLDSLLEMQTKLVGRTGEVATGEITEGTHTPGLPSDLRGEIERQILSLKGMQPSMVEIILSESALGKVARVLKPLAEIGNPNGPGETEIDEPAHEIRRPRRIGVAQSPASLGPLSPEVIFPTIDDEHPLRSYFDDEQNYPAAAGESLVPYPPAYED